MSINNLLVTEKFNPKKSISPFCNKVSSGSYQSPKNLGRPVITSSLKEIARISHVYIKPRFKFVCVLKIILFNFSPGTTSDGIYNRGVTEVGGITLRIAILLIKNIHNRVVTNYWNKRNPGFFCKLLMAIQFKFIGSVGRTKSID